MPDPETPPPPKINPAWRLTVDAPHQLAIEPGYHHDHHCHDMRPEPGSLVNMIQDANTGVLMLQPSHITADFYKPEYWRPLTATNWTFDPDYFEKVFHPAQKNSQLPWFFSSILKVGADVSYTGMLPELVGIGIIALEGTVISEAMKDRMGWVLKSNFLLSPDEGFVWYYHTISHELNPLRNGFLLQFDDIGLHLSYDGYLRVYQYDRANMLLPPKQIDEFPIASPGDMTNKSCYLQIIPIPGFGLSVYHSHSPQIIGTQASSAQAGAVRGHLIPLKRTEPTFGKFYVHQGGHVMVGMGLALELAHHRFGFYTIRYPTGPACGTYLDNIFDPGYKPTHGVGYAQAIVVPAYNVAEGGVVSVTVRNANNTATWTPISELDQGDRQGRVLVSVTNNTALYTPFILSTYISWQAVQDTRDTTPIVLLGGRDRLFELEFTEDDECRIEGRATTLMQSAAARKVVERGDTTWLLEKSFDGGTTWETHNGGLATLAGDAELHFDQTGMYYVAEWALRGMEGRFDEVTQVRREAFDSMLLSDAVNKALVMATFPQIADADLPADWKAIHLPNVLAGQNFRWAPRPGEKVDEILRQLLMLARKQYVEWFLRYDWAAHKWVPTSKPRDTATASLWTLTPFPDGGDGTGDASDDMDLAAQLEAKTIVIGGGAGSLLLTVAVEPPEANILQAFGCTSPDTKGTLIPTPPLYNVASLKDKTHPDYLGRCKSAAVVFAPLSDKDTILKMALNVYAAGCHRALKPTVHGSDYFDDFKPGMPVQVSGLDDAGALVDDIFAVVDEEGQARHSWLKRRTVHLDYREKGGEIAPSITYAMSTIWEGDVE